MIEIILFVLILAIITGIAIPNFSSTYQGLQLKTATDELSYVMRYAQSRAVTTQTPVFLEFNDTRDQYWLSGFEEEESGEMSNIRERLPGRRGAVKSIPDVVTLELTGGDGDDALQFMPDGRIEHARVILCQERRCLTVSTQEQRGYVRIYDGAIQ